MPSVVIEKINFKDIELGYEPLAEALRAAGFDWQMARTDDIHAWFSGPTAASKKFFTLPASDRGGAELSEYAVVSYIWSGIGESVALIKKERPGKIIKARTVQFEGNKLSFEVL